MIGIIDYGMGNLHSVQKALEYMGAKTILMPGPNEIESCEKLVLPGVGAFDDAMIELEKRKLIVALRNCIDNKKFFLGICLGMQLLFESSEEARETQGLGILRGVVKKFKSQKGLKVPHMGWNQLSLKNQQCPLLKNIPDESYVYFCHSYYVDAYDEIVTATCEYGRPFASIIWKDNLYGVQFHPEKSQEIGLEMLKNFVEM